MGLSNGIKNIWSSQVVKAVQKDLTEVANNTLNQIQKSECGSGILHCFADNLLISSQMRMGSAMIKGMKSEQRQGTFASYERANCYMSSYTIKNEKGESIASIDPRQSPLNGGICKKPSDE